MIGAHNEGKKFDKNPDRKIDISDSYKAQPGQKVQRPFKEKPLPPLGCLDPLDYMPEGTDLRTFLSDKGKHMP
jgi:hypothetical protein